MSDGQALSVHLMKNKLIIVTKETQRVWLSLSQDLVWTSPGDCLTQLHSQLYTTGQMAVDSCTI